MYRYEDVCGYIYVCMYMYVRIAALEEGREGGYIYTYMHEYMHMYVNMLNIHTYMTIISIIMCIDYLCRTEICTYMYLYIYVCIFIYAYTHTFIWIYIHIFIYTYILIHQH
jgi:hypothetical protein